MKRIFSNFWLQVFLGIVVGIMGVIFFYYAAFATYLRYAGFSFFDVGSSGDKSPITLVAAVLSAVLIFIFPTLTWFFLNRFGSLRSANKWKRIITFILFLTLSLWTYLGVRTYSNVQLAYANYRSIRDGCTIKNGVNKVTIGKNTKEIECKNGIYNGVTKTYNSQGIIIHEENYLDGKRNGTETVYYDDGKVKAITTYQDGKQEGVEVYYNEDGNTYLYIINHQGTSRQAYYQIPETNIDEGFSLEDQSYYCSHMGDPSLSNYQYGCLNHVLNGEFIKYDSHGKVLVRVPMTNGLFNGIYERFDIDGKLYQHLEFTNGKLDGKVEQYNSDGTLEYTGQYAHGLQSGIFRIYGYQGNIDSEVVIENGQLVQIDK